jgi:uncharacterized protein (TIGR00269 family)
MSDSKNKPVYKLQNGRSLNKIEFINYFEDKVFKTIRKFNLFDFEDKFAVAVSGGKDSITVLYLSKKYLKKKKLEKNIVAIAIDEGIANYRDKTLEFLKDFCEKHEIDLEIYSYKDIFGKTLDESILKLREKNSNISPCNICGTFRRNALNLAAKEKKVTKLITGHNIDDEAQNVLLNIFKNNFKILSRLGPINGVVRDEKFIPRIKPLYLCSEKEVRLYTILKGFDVGYDECPYSKDSFRSNIGDMINRLEDMHKGVKNSIINFYLEYKESLKDDYIEKFGDKVTYCSVCGEPSEKKVCNSCELKKLIE